MGISNAVKRPIIRTLDIFSDIVKAKKYPPEKIFIEMARGASPEQKNKRTKSRKDQIIELYLKTNRAGSCDIESAGGKSHEGNLVISANISNWKKKYADVRIIDRTASGLFECRSDDILKLL